MATPMGTRVRRDRKSDQPRRWRDQTRRRSAPEGVIQASLKIAALAHVVEEAPEPEMATERQTFFERKSDSEKVLTAEVLARLTEFAYVADEYRLQMIDATLRILRLGYENPNHPRIPLIETFIDFLILHYKNHGLATPDGVEALLAKFREDFDLAVSTAQQLADRGVVLSRAAAAAFL